MKPTYLITLLVIFSCARESKEELTDKDRKELIEEIRPTIDQIIEGARMADLDMAIEPYEMSEDFRYVGNGKVSNYADFNAYLSHSYPSLITREYEIRTESFSFLSNTAAVYTFDGKVTATFRDGNVFQSDPFGTTLVLVKKEGHWKVRNIHTSGKTEQITPD